MDATYARGIVDFVGAIQFQIGDLIKITGKDISPGWYVLTLLSSLLSFLKLSIRYSGTTSSKTGLFPIASVQLGFADPPPLESTGNFNPQKKIAKEVCSSFSLRFSPPPSSPSSRLCSNVLYVGDRQVILAQQLRTEGDERSRRSEVSFYKLCRCELPHAIVEEEQELRCRHKGFILQGTTVRSLPSHQLPEVPSNTLFSIH